MAIKRKGSFLSLALAMEFIFLKNLDNWLAFDLWMD
jgi:hypothetical protein